jgi:hypothetical protein
MDSQTKLIFRISFMVLMTAVIFYIFWKRSLLHESFSSPGSSLSAHIGIVSLMRKPVDFPVWLKHHRSMGVKRFFLRIEDTPELEEYVAMQKDIYYEMQDSDKYGNNYETLQTRQIEFVNRMFVKAKESQITWLFHIDADELLEGSFSFLERLDPKYVCVKIENAEAVYYEKEETCFSAKRFLRCSQGAPCRSYINGKGAGRTVPDVSLIGPHDFGYKNKIDDTVTYKVPFDMLHILHYDSCNFGAWAEKFRHLSDQPNMSGIPFQYYKDSIDAVGKAYNVYKKYTMPSLTDIPKELIYLR